MWIVRNRSRFSFLNPIEWYRSVQAFREKLAENKQDRRIVAGIVPVQDIDRVLDNRAGEYERACVEATKRFQERGIGHVDELYGESSARYFRARNVREKMRADLLEMSQIRGITFCSLREKLKDMQGSLPVPSNDRHGRASYCFNSGVYDSLYLELTTNQGGFRGMLNPIHIADVKVADIQYAGKR